MSLKTKLVLGTALSLAGLVGCGSRDNSNSSQSTKPSQPIKQKYFAEVNYSISEYESSGAVALSSADFDGDGDVDLVLAYISQGDPNKNRVRLSLFKNDGEGNFYQDSPTTQESKP